MESENPLHAAKEGQGIHTTEKVSRCRLAMCQATFWANIRFIGQDGLFGQSPLPTPARGTPAVSPPGSTMGEGFSRLTPQIAGLARVRHPIMVRGLWGWGRMYTVCPFQRHLQPSEGIDTLSGHCHVTYLVTGIFVGLPP